jgi:hypothetical protein
MDMSASTRRSVMAVLLGMGLSIGLGPRLPRLSAANALPLRLPDSPLRLERVLERGLHGGGAIIVRRSWIVTFARQSRGIIATGTQSQVEINAPPQLAGLARLEKQRDTGAMFPIMLSDSGEILVPGNNAEDRETIAAALRLAEDMIARSPGPASERARLRHYLAEMHRAGSGALDALPTDLLFPAGETIERSETVNLPDGLKGSFSLAYTAQPHADAPWLHHAQRRVETVLGDLSSATREAWSLGVTSS